jgi:hypothetical protein
MALVEHAQEELRRAGLYESDSDYGGMIGQAVEDLVATLAAQGHSGMSAEITLAAFGRVARFKTLTPLTSDPAEWNDVSEYSGRPMWQSRRQSDTFSTDGGQTWYSIDDGPVSVAPSPQENAGT